MKSTPPARKVKPYAAEAVQPDWFGVARSEIQIAIAAFVLCFVARFHGLLPGYSFDDYLLFRGDNGERAAARAISDGRPLVYVLRAALSNIDTLPPFSFVIGWFALSAALILVGLLACRIWGVDRRPAAACVAVLFIALHPYQTELFTFHVTPLFVAIALSLSFVGLTYCLRSRLYWILSVAMLVASLSLYQVVINYMAMTLVFAALFYWTADKKQQSLFTGGLAARCGAVVAAVAAYITMNALLAWGLNIPLTERSRLLPLDQLATRIPMAGRALSTMFGSDEPVMPAGTKWILWSLPLSWLLWSSIRKLTRSAKWRNQGFLIAAMVVATPLTLGVVLVLNEWWPVPRVTAQIGIFWAGTAVFCIIHSTGVFRRVLVSLAGIAVFAFIGGDNHILLDQLRLNMRDIAKANRIVMRLEALPDFPQLRGVVVNGGHWSYPFELHTMEGDLNVSALFAALAKIPLLNEVSGYNFTSAPADINQAAEVYCQSVPKWPAVESVTSIQSYGVVCLKKP